MLTHAYRTGGHTALVRRWIEMAPGTEHHDAALTHQLEDQWPEAFVRSVHSRGGRIVPVAAASRDILVRADVLRKLSEEYDVVVLHVHPWDVVPVIAFGASGGCPILFMNHADHVFWFGGSIADAVLNIRTSGELLSREQRACRVNLRLPLPLPVSNEAPTDDDRRLKVRECFGIDANAVVFLTIGSRFKYLPVGNLDFRDAVIQLLERRANAVMLVVGPAAHEDGWPPLVSRFGSRLRVVGTQTDLTSYFELSDIYMEGFPFGSLTALLEAVLAGLAPVLAPSLCPLPFRSDDFVLDTLPIAASVADYVDLALSLADNVAAARNKAAGLAQLLRVAHSPPGWLVPLSAVAEFVRDVDDHSVASISGAHPLDTDRVQYWAEFIDRARGDTAFGWAYRTAMREGLTPRVDLAMMAALRSAKAQGLSSLKPWTKTLGSHVLAALPKKVANYLYERI